MVAVDGGGERRRKGRSFCLSPKALFMNEKTKRKLRIRMRCFFWRTSVSITAAPNRHHGRRGDKRLLGGLGIMSAG